MNYPLTLLLTVSNIFSSQPQMEKEIISVTSREQPVQLEILCFPIGPIGHPEDITEKERTPPKPPKNSSEDGEVDLLPQSFGLPIPNNPVGGSHYLQN